MVTFRLEWGTAVRARRARVQKRVDLLLEQAFLDSVEKLFGLLKRQAQVFDALRVLFQGDNVCHRFFTAISRLCHGD